MASINRFIVLTAFALGLTACDSGRDSPTSPTRPVVPDSPFVGTWRGSIEDDVAGAGALRLDVTEHVAISLLGSWAATFADPAFSDGGVLTATVDDGIVRLVLMGRGCASPDTGSRTVAATLNVDGARMVGGYLSLGCGAPREGRIEVARE